MEIGLSRGLALSSGAVFLDEDEPEQEDKDKNTQYKYSLHSHQISDWAFYISHCPTCRLVHISAVSNLSLLGPHLVSHFVYQTGTSLVSRYGPTSSRPTYVYLEVGRRLAAELHGIRLLT